MRRFLYIAVVLVFICLYGCTITSSSRDGVGLAPPTRGEYLSAAPEEPTKNSITSTATPNVLGADTPSPQADASLPVLPSPIVSATATPFPTIMWSEFNHSDYAVIWPVPLGWEDVSTQIHPKYEHAVFWGAWANSAASVPLLEDDLADMVQVFSLQVLPAADVPTEMVGLEQKNGWGQTVWFVESRGNVAESFGVELAFTAVSDTYYYIFSLGCAAPTTMADDELAAFCHHIWDSVAGSLAFCTPPTSAADMPTAWQAVTDSRGHDFEIPAAWPTPKGVETEAYTLWSHPLDIQPMACPLPEQFAKVDVSLLSSGNFATQEQKPEEGKPNLDGFLSVSNTTYPAWVSPIQPDGEGGHFPAEARVLYIQTGGNWAQFIFFCAPTWTAVCEETMTHIATSFR